MLSTMYRCPNSQHIALRIATPNPKRSRIMTSRILLSFLLLLLLESGALWAWDAGRGSFVMDYMSDYVWHPGGREIALSVAGGASINIVDAETGRTIRELATGRFSPVLTLSHDSSLLAVPTQDGTIVHIFDFASGEEIAIIQIDQTSEIVAMQFLPDDSRLIIVKNWSEVEIWSVAGNEQILSYKLQPLSPDVARLTFIPLRLAAAADMMAVLEGAIDQVAIIRASTGERLQVIRPEGFEFISHMNLADDGSRLALAATGQMESDDELRVYRPADATELWRYTAALQAYLANPVFVPGGDLISGVHADTLAIWDLNDGSVLTTIPFHVPLGLSHGDHSHLFQNFLEPKFANDATTIGLLRQRSEICTFGDIVPQQLATGFLAIFDPQQGKIQSYIPPDVHLVNPDTFAANRNATRILSRDIRGRTIIWNADDGSFIQHFTTSTPSNLISNDGMVLYSLTRDSLLAFDIASGELQSRIQIPLGCDYGAVLTADGGQLLCASENGVSIVNLPEVRLLTEWQLDLTSLSFNKFVRDGRLLLTVREDSLFTWDTMNGKQVSRQWLADRHSTEQIVDASLDGKRLASTALRHINNSLSPWKKVLVRSVATGRIVREIVQRATAYGNLTWAEFTPASNYIQVGGSDPDGVGVAYRYFVHLNSGDSVCGTLWHAQDLRDVAPSSTKRAWIAPDNEHAIISGCVSFRFQNLPCERIVLKVDERNGHSRSEVLSVPRPHPFVDAATLALVLDRPGIHHLRVVIRDLFGRMRRTVFEGSLLQGEHEVTLQRQGLPAGVYHLEIYEAAGALLSGRQIVIAP